MNAWTVSVTIEKSNEALARESRNFSPHLYISISRSFMHETPAAALSIFLEYRAANVRKKGMQACGVTILQQTSNEVLRVSSKYSPKGKTSGLVYTPPCLFAHTCKYVIIVLLFTVLSSWFSVLCIVPVIWEDYKPAATMETWQVKFSACHIPSCN
jgi:hypothetical protein